MGYERDNSRPPLSFWFQAPAGPRTGDGDCRPQPPRRQQKRRAPAMATVAGARWGLRPSDGAASPSAGDICSTPAPDFARCGLISVHRSQDVTVQHHQRHQVLQRAAVEAGIDDSDEIERRDDEDALAARADRGAPVDLSTPTKERPSQNW